METRPNGAKLWSNHEIVRNFTFSLSSSDADTRNNGNKYVRYS